MEVPLACFVCFVYFLESDEGDGGIGGWLHFSRSCARTSLKSRTAALAAHCTFAFLHARMGLKRKMAALAAGCTFRVLAHEDGSEEEDGGFGGTLHFSRSCTR